MRAYVRSIVPDVENTNKDSVRLRHGRDRVWSAMLTFQGHIRLAKLFVSGQTDRPLEGKCNELDDASFSRIVYIGRKLGSSRDLK